MDALRNIHSALTQGGLVVDTQPVGPQPRVAVEGEVIGTLDMFEWMSTIAAVDSTVEDAVGKGLFEICHEATLVVADSFDSGSECLRTVADWRDTRVPPALVDRLEATQAVVSVEQDVRLRLLRSH